MNEDLKIMNSTWSPRAAKVVVPSQFSFPIYCSLFFAIWSSACSAPPRIPVTAVSHVGRAVPIKDAADLLGRVRQASHGYRQLRTVHAVTVVMAPGKPGQEKRFLRGVLAVRRPGLFRLVVLGPGGFKAMDVIFGAGRHRLLYLAPQLKRASLLPTIVASLSQDIRVIYDLQPAPYVTRRVVEETVATASGRAPLYELREYRKELLARQITVFAASLAVSRIYETDELGERRTITFGDYQRRGRYLYPKTIHVARDGSLSYWLMINVEQLELDQPLDERLFRDTDPG